jgi:hypothetical protein
MKLQKWLENIKEGWDIYWGYGYIILVSALVALLMISFYKLLFGK